MCRWQAWEGMEVCRYKARKCVDGKHGSVQVADMEVYRRHVWKFAGMEGRMFGSVQIWKCASMKVCKYGSMQVWKRASM